LRTQNSFRRRELRTWKSQLNELLKRRCVFYESRKPIKIAINKERVIAMATETNRRLDRWGLMALGAPGAGHRVDHHRAVCADVVHVVVLRDVARRRRADDASSSSVAQPEIARRRRVAKEPPAAATITRAIGLTR
jgi:hypothetical protein